MKGKITFLLLFSVCLRILYAQTNFQLTEYDVNTLLGSDSLENINYTDGYVDEVSYNSVSIYPLGWSGDGKFCYITKTYSFNLHAFPIYRWFIKDMVTDNDVWVSDPDVEEKLPAYFEQYRNSNTRLTEFDYFFELYYKEYKEILKKHNINLYSDNEFTYGEVFSFSNMDYEISLKMGKTDNEFFDGAVDQNGEEVNFLDEFQVFLSRQSRKKRIFHYLSSGVSSIMRCNILGFFSSPYEDRIAVLFVTQQYPNEFYLSAHISGAHLISGFEK